MRSTVFTGIHFVTAVISFLGHGIIVMWVAALCWLRFPTYEAWSPRFPPQVHSLMLLNIPPNYCRCSAFVRRGKAVVQDGSSAGW